MVIILFAAFLILLIESTFAIIDDDISWKNSSFSVSSNPLESEILRSFSFERYSVNEAGVLSIPMSAEEHHRYITVEMEPGDAHRDSDGSFGLSQFASSAQIVGCASLVFSVPVSIGSSRSTFNLIVDTGSTTMAVASSRCTGCHVSPLWSASSSTQQQYTAGPVTSIYASNTGWSGQAYKDSVSIGSASATLIFSSIDSTQGSFFQSAGCDGSSRGNTNQGIMGFAYSRLALPPTQGFFQQWQSQTNGANIFTIQMCQRSGNLWIGGYDNQYKGRFRWTPIVDTIWYSVHINSVSVNGQTLSLSSTQLNPGDSAVDSGTTMTILPSALYTSIVNSISSNSAFVNAFGSSFLTAGYCSKPRNGHTITQLNNELPRITYNFGGINGDTPLSLTLNPISSYLYVIQSGNTWLVCPGLVNGGNNGAVFGYTFMNQFIVAFDVGMNRLGFAPCDNCNGYDSNGIPYGSPPGIVTGGIITDTDSYNTPPVRIVQPPVTQRPSTSAPVTSTTAPTCSVAVWWQTSTYGSCSKSCGGGTKTRSVTCLNMAMMAVSDSLCACSNAKPASIDSCNTNECVATPMYVSSVLLNDSSSALSAPFEGVVEISFNMSSPDTSTHVDTVMIWIQTNSNSLPTYISRSTSVSYLKDTAGINVAQGSYLWTIDSSLTAGPYQIAVGISSTSYQVASTLTLYDPCANACDSTTETCQNEYGEPVCTSIPTTIPPTLPSTVLPSTDVPSTDVPSTSDATTSSSISVSNSTTNTNTTDLSGTSTPTNVAFCLNGGTLLNESTTSTCTCSPEYSGDICEMLSTPLKFYFYYSYSSMEGQENQLIALILTDIAYSLNISTSHIYINSISNGTYTVVDVSLSCDTHDSSCTSELLNGWISQIRVLVNDSHSRLYMGLAGHRVAKVDIPIIQETSSSSSLNNNTNNRSVPLWAIGLITSVAVLVSMMVSVYMYYKYWYTKSKGKHQQQTVQPSSYTPKPDISKEEEEIESSDKLSELKLERMIELNRPKRLEKSTSSSGIAMLKRGQIGGVSEATDPVSPYVDSNIPASPYLDEFTRNISEHVVHIN